MATMERSPLAARHIQNQSAADSLEPHWGYVDRVVPCTNDAGSCEYLDLVYYNHDISMLYSGILWATIGGILFIWAIGRRLWPSLRADEVVNVDTERAATSKKSSSRLKSALASSIRSYLLPDSIQAIFGRTTRLQVLILAVLSGYLLIWSFVGIYYKTWITPVKNTPGLYNTRTSIGPWSDRVGILAYALTPLSILLSSRESILSVLTGVPYQSFNFLHRWLGYIIFVQGSLHTIAWCIVEIRLYQPQPSTGIEWITQTYMIWGLVAMILLTLLVVLSTPWGIRLTGYETFRKTHYVLAMVYIGGCWGHWQQLKCFLLPSLLIWILDRGIRLARMALTHYQYLTDGKMGFRAIPATLTHFPDSDHGDIVRMDFLHSQDAWKIGQHFYLCFTECSIWQSHPFTPLNLPEVKDGVVAHSYILRAKKGETKKVADLAAKKLSENQGATTPLILSGPYGESIAENLTPDRNVLCVAGGTGITYVLPVLLSIAQKPASPDRKFELIWAVRKRRDLQWVEPELAVLRAAAVSHKIDVHIFVTREQSRSSSSENEKAAQDDVNIKELGPSSSAPSSVSEDPALYVKKIGMDGHDTHPDLKKMIGAFVAGTVRGSTTVYASGPGGMISDLRSIVAACNSGPEVWKGNEQFDVCLTCDDRLEW